MVQVAGITPTFGVAMEQEPQTRVLSPDSHPGSGRSSEGARSPSGAQRAVTMPPQQVGRYALLRRLAHGGMATVYLGRVSGTAGFEKVVAVKLIHPHLAEEPDFLEMFLDEARIAAKIQHPHVVEILDLGEDHGTHFMAMEWIEGETLSALVRALRPGTLPLAVTLRIISDTLIGLAAAHELTDETGRPLGLVHRDVSPQNLLISMAGWVKVTDFGIMKAAGRHGRTRTGELRGKVAYMSPEQARGENVDARSDLFAVGVILWELLTGDRLFARATEAATLERVIACEVPDLPDDALEGVSEDMASRVRSLVSRSLAKHPSGRFDNARSMLDAAQALLREVSENDPRTALSQIMHAEFGERVAYVRASLREVSTQDTPALPPSVLDPGVRTGSQSMRGSVQEATGVGSPRRAWALLIALPLLGALVALGMATALGLGRDKGESEGAPAIAPQETPPASVHWFVSTEPEGASITIDGALHPEVTPTEVSLAKGQAPVTMVLEKAGMRPTKATLRPLGDDNLFYRLVPVAGSAAAGGDSESGEAADAGTGSAAGTGDPEGKSRIKPRFRPPLDNATSTKGSGVDGSGTGSAAEAGADDAGDAQESKGGSTGGADGGLRPMPDFEDEPGVP